MAIIKAIIAGIGTPASNGSILNKSRIKVFVGIPGINPLRTPPPIPNKLNRRTSENKTIHQSVQSYLELFPASPDAHPPRRQNKRFYPLVNHKLPIFLQYC